jgi:hypothetical protein
MTTLAEADQFGAATIEHAAPEFRIAILYETQAIGAAALQMCERLMTSFQNAFRFYVAIESFSAIEEESRFRKALEAAVEADMIFVGSAGSLPAAFLRWLKECMARRRDEPTALVDLTAEESANALAVHRFLKEVAQTNHLDLISKEVIGPPGRTTSLSSSHSSIVRHWGINE